MLAPAAARCRAAGRCFGLVAMARSLRRPGDGATSPALTLGRRDGGAAALTSTARWCGAGGGGAQGALSAITLVALTMALAGAA